MLSQDHRFKPCIHIVCKKKVLEKIEARNPEPILANFPNSLEDSSLKQKECRVRPNHVTDAGCKKRWDSNDIDDFDKNYFEREITNEDLEINNDKLVRTDTESRWPNTDIPYVIQ